MTGPISHETDEPAARPLGAHTELLIQAVADLLHDFEIFALRICTNSIRFAQSAPFKNAEECTRMVLDEEPIPDVFSGAVYRELLTRQSLDDRQRNQLLGKMIGAVVVEQLVMTTGSP